LLLLEQSPLHDSLSIKSPGAGTPLPPSPFGDPDKASEGQSLWQLVSTVMGAGVLGFPFCYRACGLALATLLVVVTLVAAEFSMRLLLLAGAIASKRSYEDLARHCFGGAGARAVGACVAVMSAGSLVGYLNLLADVSSLVAGTVIPPGAEPSRNATLAAITLGAVLPVALTVRSPRLLAGVSRASVAFLAFFALILGVLAAAPGAQGVGTSGAAWWRWDGLLVSFPVVVYSYSAHQALFSIYHDTMRAASLRRMTAVVQKSMALSSLLYVAVGACGFIAFGQRTSGDILRNFGGPEVTGARLVLERLLKARPAPAACAPEFALPGSIC
jgi:sodium-coupled neutral amino acid transporter 10